MADQHQADPFHSLLRMPAYTSTFKDFMKMAWPNFIQLKECTLLEDIDFGRLFHMIDLSKNSLASIETQLNKRRLIDLLPGNAPNNVGDLIAVGKQFQEMWATKLSVDFPGDRYSVIFTEGSLGEDVENFELTFFKIRW